MSRHGPDIAATDRFRFTFPELPIVACRTTVCNPLPCSAFETRSSHKNLAGGSKNVVHLAHAATAEKDLFEVFKKKPAQAKSFPRVLFS